MKILYETPEGYMAAADCDAITAVPQPDDDRWCVRVKVHGIDGWDTVAGDLTEKSAKNIVRKLFDYGVYTHCP